MLCAANLTILQLYFHAQPVVRLMTTNHNVVAGKLKILNDHDRNFLKGLHVLQQICCMYVSFHSIGQIKVRLNTE